MTSLTSSPLLDLSDMSDQDDENAGLLLNYDKSDEIREDPVPPSSEVVVLQMPPSLSHISSSNTEGRIAEISPLLGGLNSAQVVANDSLASSTPPNTNSKSSQRLMSLDIFRGCTILWMILVDNQGGVRGADDVSWPFKESSWNGVHMSDWVFPSFIFIAGTAIYLASKANLANRACGWRVWFRVIRRWVILFLLGFILNLIAVKFDFARVRIMGILQRIGTCYLIAAALLLLFPIWVQWLMIALFYAVYVGVLYGVHVPNYVDNSGATFECGVGNITSQCNAASWIDRSILGSHMIQPTDPEGLFSTLTATVTMWFGLEFGRLVSLHRYQTLIRARVSPQNWPFMIRAEVIWFLLVSILLLAGGISNLWLPFNKKIWSLSFTLFMSGLGGGILGLLYFFLDVWLPAIKETRPFSWLCNAFYILGTNPIIIFVGMILLEIILLDLAILPSGESAWTFIYEKGFVSWIENRQAASFVFSIPHVLLWWGVAAILNKLRFFLKI